MGHVKLFAINKLKGGENETSQSSEFFFRLFLVILFLINFYSADADARHPTHNGDLGPRSDFGYREKSNEPIKVLNHTMIMTAMTEHLRNKIETAPPLGNKNHSHSRKRPLLNDPHSTGRLGLSLTDFIQLVREKNEQIRFRDLEWAISREAVKGANAIFEPAFVSTYQHGDLRQRTTLKERVELNFLPEFAEKSTDYEAALEGVVPTGARLRLGYSLRAFRNTLDEAYGIEREYKTFIGASITQPLLKDGGIKTTMAGIQVAEADADIAFQAYREQMMRTISEAIAAYWDLYSAQEKYKVREDSVHIAEQILRDNLVRVRTGKMAETEVLEARAGLALRKSFLSQAKQEIISAMNKVRTLFSFSAAEKEVWIEATDRIEIDEIKPDFGESLLKAFKLRAEYISSRRKLEREDIRLVFAKNQRWPQLDLKGSYGLNGLADSSGESWDDAWDRDFKTWTVGVELRIPITGDMKARSELEASRKRKKQVLLELKAVEVALANAVDTAIRSVHSAEEQVRYYANVVDYNRRLLDVEIARFNAGKSNSRLLLEREEDLIRAKEAELESLVKYKEATLELETAEGSVLLSHGIEVMDVEL